jgi:hypothetical protein
MSQPQNTPQPAGADIVQSLDDLGTAAGLSTLRNKILKDPPWRAADPRPGWEIAFDRPAAAVSEAEDVARSREFLRQGVGTTTRRNRVLPAARLPSPIPARVGKAGPREEVGTYVEVDYALRVLSGQNATTYHYEMLNTPLDGNMRLYLQPRPLDTPAGDSNYYASAVKLTTTDGLLKTDYQLKLKTAIIRPASGDDKLIGIGAAPVTGWFAEFDLVRGPTGVHALVKKAKKVDMLVDGTPETLTLKPPPYTKPAGNGLCVLDEILKLGDPWHGLIQGGTVRLPGGKTRPVARPGIGVGVVYPLIPYGVTPAATADAADVAAGRTWLNYGLLAGDCLYEQSISSAFPCWVYIAPDNSTWRVAYAHVFIAGVWKLQLQFYPLRRVFLTDDKWGGLAQTIQVEVNPAPWSYTQGLLYDLDSKGANAIFRQQLNPHQTIVTGAAHCSISKASHLLPLRHIHWLLTLQNLVLLRTSFTRLTSLATTPIWSRGIRSMRPSASNRTRMATS